MRRRLNNGPQQRIVQALAPQPDRDAPTWERPQDYMQRQLGTPTPSSVSSITPQGPPRPYEPPPTTGRPPPQPQPVVQPPPPPPAPLAHPEGANAIHYANAVAQQYGGDHYAAVNAITGGRLLPPGTPGGTQIGTLADGTPLYMNPWDYDAMPAEAKTQFMSYQMGQMLQGQMDPLNPAYGQGQQPTQPSPYPQTPAPAPQAPPPNPWQNAQPQPMPQPQWPAPPQIQQAQTPPLTSQGGIAPQGRNDPSGLAGQPWVKPGGNDGTISGSVGGTIQNPMGAPHPGTSNAQTQGQGAWTPPGSPQSGWTPPNAPTQTPTNPSQGPTTPNPVGSSLSFSPEAEAVRRTLDDELSQTLASIGVERSQIPLMLALATERLKHDHDEELRLTNEDANRRGIFDSGIRTTNRGKVNQGFDRRRQDMASEAARQYGSLASRESGARSNYNRGFAELLLSLAQRAAENPDAVVGVSDEEASPGGGSKNVKNKSTWQKNQPSKRTRAARKPPKKRKKGGG